MELTPLHLGTQSRNSTRLAVVGFCVLLFVAVVIRNAWLCDDAYITFRTVDNFIHGYGLTWNTGERVQAYTHPLWMFLLSAIYAITHEIYYSSIFLSIFVSAVSVAIICVFAGRRSVWGAASAFCILLFSKSFIDFSTAGLENPLTHLLLALFFGVYLAADSSSRSLFLLSLLMSLAMLTRMDLVLILAPPLALMMFEYRRPNGFLFVALGLLPIVAWELFSILYYGFPFPNTAYAKLAHGWPASILAGRGLHYFVASLRLDFVALPVIAGGCLLALSLRRKREAAAVIGVVLYLIYLVRAGGDFMAGRFFTAPFVPCVILLAASPLLLNRFFQIGIPLAAAILGIVSPYPTLLSGANYRVEEDPSRVGDDRHISDERGFYYRGLGLLRVWRGLATPSDHEWARIGREAAAVHDCVVCVGYVGLVGFYAGPTVHIVDTLALADPLLARLPAVKSEGLWIGHFSRKVPGGYLSGLVRGVNGIEDEQVAAFNDELSLVTRGRLFSSERMRAIFRINLGLTRFDAAPAKYEILPDQSVAPAILHVTLSSAVRAFDSGNGLRFFSHTDGNRIYLPSVSHAREIELEIGGGHDYQIAYMNGENHLARTVLRGKEKPEGEIVAARFPIPPEVSASGFDSIWILTLPPGEGDFSLNRLRFTD